MACNVHYEANNVNYKVTSMKKQLFGAYKELVLPSYEDLRSRTAVQELNNCFLRPEIRSCNRKKGVSRFKKDIFETKLF